MASQFGWNCSKATLKCVLKCVSVVKMQARLSNKGQTPLHEGRTSVCLARGSNDMIMSMVSTNQPKGQ